MLAETLRPGSSQGLDFVRLDELRKRTGIEAKSVLAWPLMELLANALDKDASTIDVRLGRDGPFYRLAVSDNGGKKISDLELRLILDFDKKSSSKRGFLRGPCSMTKTFEVQRDPEEDSA